MQTVILSNGTQLVLTSKGANIAISTLKKNDVIRQSLSSAMYVIIDVTKTYEIDDDAFFTVTFMRLSDLEPFPAQTETFAGRETVWHCGELF